MQTLRNTPYIARLVLVWVALFVGVLAASPLVKPADIQLVCSASGGFKLSVVGEDLGDSPLAGDQHCPLCQTVGATPWPLPDFQFRPQPLAHALRPVVAARLAWVTAPPLPSRGPPVLLV